MVIARHLNISGHVQGVWYRNWTVDTARILSLVGWVRNRADGNVETWVEGSEEVVTRFITLAQEGPPAARVVQILAQEVEPQGFTGFEKRPTA
ncbi:acylphosphatase [Sphingobium aromaticiconvertens]|uniref:acylphosphatase n=1 Tax=Sphingobium aromaticiconvertens TaxID=365341 RepID=UPI003017FA14